MSAASVPAGRSATTRRLAWVGAAAAAALLLAVLGLALFHQNAVPTRSVVGARAPEVTVRTLDGHAVSLAGMRGTPVVLNVWASWCAPCRQEAPALNDAARKWNGQVAFLGVDFKDADQAALAYQADVRTPYPVGPADGGMPAAYGVTAPPETFFIDAQGVVVAQFQGPIDGPAIDRYLQLAGIRS